jgi:sugar (pentulose or hexulose) kinase
VKKGFVISSRVEAVLAIDVGSSSTRIAAVSLNGEILLRASAATPVERPVPGWEQVDPGSIWQIIVELATTLSLGDLDLRAIGVSALLSTALFDSAGSVLGPALLWSDSRGREWARSPSAATGSSVERIARRPVTGELLGPRLHWLEAEHPDLATRVSRIGSLKDALVTELTGAAVTDATHASYTGLFDVVSGNWSTELSGLWGVDDAVLPPVEASASCAGTIMVEPAAQLGVPPGIPVAVGGPDGTVGALGAGGCRPGVAVDIAGTTDVLTCLVDRALPDPSATTILNAFSLPSMWGLGGPTGMTGGAIDWLGRLVGFRSASEAFAAFEEEIEGIGIGAGGVFFRPELTGERFPGWHASASGAVMGLRVDHGPAHLLRAGREASAFTVASGLEAVANTGARVDELIVAGGLARDPRALQMRADVCGLPVLASENPEVTTLGAAILGGLAAGIYGSADEAVAMASPQFRRFEPDLARTAEYNEVRARWHRYSQDAG